jgi:hypothetical protein
MRSRSRIRASLVPVGLRAAFVRLLSRGEPPDRDPDELVEVALVPLHEGPLLIARLDEAGVAASGIESYDVATSVRNRMRIMVRRRDVETASRLLEGSPPDT